MTDTGEFSAGAEWDAAAHVRFLRVQGAGLAGYTADLIERLYRALAALQGQEPGWQPIETAPRDGTYILAYGPFGGATDAGDWAQRCIVLRYVAQDGGDFVWATTDSEEGVWAQSIPTHWMPLPAAPLPPDHDTKERK